MPLYTVITQEHSLSGETKLKMADEITRIHTAVMKVPRSFVRVVFLSYPAGSGYTAGVEAPTAALNCVLQRPRHGREEGHAPATLVHVSNPDRNCQRSTGNFSSGDPVEQCHGNGADHASGRFRVEFSPD